MNTTEAKAAIETILNTESQNQRQAAAEQEDKWTGYFNKVISLGGGLSGVSVPPREAIIGNWFKKGDLGFICGARGMGKTWLAMLIGRKCAEGLDLTGLPEWKIRRPWRVLYVDGEMPMDGTRERDVSLAAAGAPGLFYLHHEALFHHTGEALNLADTAAQTALLKRCLRDKIEIVILDNLSCLFSGMRENDADAWDRVLPWLLDLRRNKIAVIFVAHSGRNGYMRGTSRREDAAFWIINLSELREPGDSQQGAKFVAQFVKCRNATEADCPPLEWRFVKHPNNPKVIVTWEKLSGPLLFRQYVEGGMDSATEIAKEMGVSKSVVSKYANRGIEEGWLRKKGRNYALVSAADQELNRMLEA
ncbi:MAG TPA: AAA family ATPase [Candidatus Sulfotelmatobacter sp.]|nr:AAA family ATPase [Candidatus Sulfotelmatobacter sp.]